MRSVAANRTAFCFDRQVFQTATGKNPAVGAVHTVVDFVELFHGRAEAVGVFHQKFTGTQHAEAGAFFVAEFSLNLIDRQRQLFVAADAVTDEIGDHFFVGRSKCHGNLSISPGNIELNQHRAEGFFSLCAFKQADRLQGRHVEFCGPGGVHFFTDNLRGFLNCLPSQWEVSIGARYQLADQTGS